MILAVPFSLLKDLVLVVGALLVVSLLTIVGLRRLKCLWAERRDRLRQVYPYIGLLTVVLILNSYVRNYGQAFSLLLEWRITGLIYSIEGSLVADIQTYLTTGFVTLPGITQLTQFLEGQLGTPPHEQVIALFSLIYVYGYVFLMVFPFFAYLAKDRMDSFRQLMLAYGFNYTIGVLCYVLFIAYGPRNFLVPEVEALMYQWWPRSQILTGEINTNTNVFPSLHTSISLTVALFAYRTRDTYRTWLYIATPIALGVVISTMFLGIHWGVDVVAGAGLAVVSVVLADKVTDESGKNAWLDRAGQRVVDTLRQPFRVAREYLSELRSENTEGQSR